LPKLPFGCMSPSILPSGLYQKSIHQRRFKSTT